MPTLTGHSVYKLRTTEQFANHGSLILGITLAIHAAAWLATGSLSKGHPLQEADGSFGRVRLILVQKFLLATPSRI
ncbi:hypothetical protein EVA_07748 [gut metagenome]|uniref:Uncharacterized protein n=1 Tax=gut metagenome TaxID=749906 RepID=J9GA46_9ZZZZ